LFWCAATASVVFWVLNYPRGSAISGPSQVQTADLSSSGPSSAHLARAWGAQAPAPEVNIAQTTRFELLGVVAGASGLGSALIAVDGQPPRPFKVGQTVTEGLVLQSLERQKAQLGVSTASTAAFTLTRPSKDKTP
jgi:general secretion pathway protein C